MFTFTNFEIFKTEVYISLFPEESEVYDDTILKYMSFNNIKPFYVFIIYFYLAYFLCFPICF
jgi:hypothetical protein